MYRKLRSAYEVAFRQLASVEGPNDFAVREQVAGAQRCYLEARNALADYLLARQREYRRCREQQLASIQERAYFVWENTGKPSGTDQANWYRAEAQYPRGTLSAGCGC